MLRETFRKTIFSHGMDLLMKDCGTVIAAYSGGADSAALLFLLREYTEEHGIRLAAAHVNHMIRGEEADADERLAAETAERLGISIHVKRVDVPSRARETGCGLEEAARNERYAFFEELSRQYGGALIATAHNADDNLETVLFHLMRGTGLRGLCGIDPVRDGIFIRPLIACTGSEIREFCRTQRIPYAVDSTNTDTEYTRNYIRHRVTPVLEAAFESPSRSVLRMTELLRNDSDFIEREAEALCPEDTVLFSREKLNRLHPALAARILRNLHRSASADHIPLPEYVHFRAMLDLSGSDRCEGSISLPGGMIFRVNRNEVFFQLQQNSDGEESRTDFRHEMDKDGSVFENDLYKLIISPEEHNFRAEEYENIYKLSIHQKMCSDKIIGALYIKYRNNGDTYRYGGMTRKIKKLMVDRKLTAEEKNLLPILCDGKGILWMPYCPLRDGTGPDSSTEKTIHLYFYKK